MQETLLPLLAGPDNGCPLTLSEARCESGEIVSGLLTDTAGCIFPIEDGIPRLLPAALLAEQRSEITARDAQAEAYDRMAFLRAFGAVEIPLTRRTLALQPGDRLLEGGCGTGRMTQVWASQARDVVAVDFSFESLRANQRKLRAAGITNVHLVQADLCHLPLAEGLFDRVVSCQVLEHVPGEAARQLAVQELARVGKPQSRLVLSAYQHSPATRLFGQKEGAHEGGIPFFRFTRPELRALLSSAFTVHSITGTLIYLYLARCTKQ